MTLYFYSFFVFGQLSQFGQVTKNYQEAKANHELLQEMMLQQPEAPDHYLPSIEQVQTIKIADISFGYTSDKQVVHNFSAHRQSGQTIAFV